MCVCVLGLGNRRREGKTRERLCAWEPDLFCFWFHWGERESESEWYHDIVLVLFLMLHYDLASICGVALGLNALLWDFLSSSLVQALTVTITIKITFPTRMVNMCVWYKPQASATRSVSGVGRSAPDPAATHHLIKFMRMAVLLLWALSGRCSLHSPV